MVRICFVCLGNICRSPTAEGIMLKLVADQGLTAQIAIDSAGTAGYHKGEPADRRSAQVASSRGVALPSRARQFMAADFGRFDYVLAMDGDNAARLRQLAPNAAAAGKVQRLREYQADAPDLDVPDPYYGGPGGFDAVFDMCDEACRGLLAHIRKVHAL